MARHGTELVKRMCECIAQMHERADDELRSYMAELGITWSEQWRTDFLRLLEQQNEQYRRTILKKLRSHATHVQQLDLESPLHVQVEAAINTDRRLQTQLSQVEELYATRINMLQHGIKNEVVEQISSARDLIELISTRTRGIRASFNALRRELHPMLNEGAFDVLVNGLRWPLPARVQKRPLYRIAERLRALRATRVRCVRKADRMHLSLTALDNPSLPDEFVNEVTRLRDSMQRAGWRQSDLIQDLEFLLVEAEGSPSFLVLDGQEVPLDRIFAMVRQYEQLPIDLKALQERATNVEGRLSLLTSVLMESCANGSQAPDA